MGQYRLARCVWEITLACCFSCRFCGSSGGKARANEISGEEGIRIAGELAELGCERVSLIGGEVFMHPAWRQIVRALREHKIAVNIITNGFLFTDTIIRDLKSFGVESVSVSLDGPGVLHDKYRQEGSFNRVNLAIGTLAKAGIPVSVITTLNKENAEHLQEMYEILKAYPIYAWQLQACSPMGNAANGGIDVAFDPREVIRFVEEHMHAAPFALGIADNIGYFTPGEGSLRGNMSGTAYFKGCSAGISSIGIDSVLNVRGCESMYDEAFIEGNLREQSLKEIWEDPEKFAYNRKFTPELLSGKCAECSLGAWCGGGCRSYNYFVHGKLYESPRCARNM